jgi:hypothetical protein
MVDNDTKLLNTGGRVKDYVGDNLRQSATKRDNFNNTVMLLPFSDDSPV